MLGRFDNADLIELRQKLPVRDTILTAGSNVTLTQTAPNAWTIASSGGGGGGSLPWTVLSYDTTGAVSASAALQTAITALGSTGGGIIIPPGTFKWSTTVTLDSNVPISVYSPGVAFNVDAAVTALIVDGDNLTLAPGCFWSGGVFTGTKASSVCMVVRNGMRFYCEHVYIRNFLQGVVLNPNLTVSAADYAESNMWVGCNWNNCATAVDTTLTGTATGSIDQCAFIRCDFSGIGSGDKGVNLTYGIDAWGLRFNDCAFWMSDGGTGLYIDCRMDGIEITSRFEEIAGTTPTAGIYIGPNAYDLRRCHVDATFAGTWTTNTVVIDAGQATQGFTYTQGTEKISVGSTNTWEPWVAGRNISDTKNRVEFRPGAGSTSMPGIVLGDGSTDPDCNIYRRAANRIQSDDLVTLWKGVATLTKAGAVVDADFPATPTDGTIAVDTTNRRFYVRIGGVWRWCDIPSASSSFAVNQTTVAFTDGDTARRVTVTDAGVAAGSKIVLAITRPFYADSDDPGFLYVANIVNQTAGSFDVLIQAVNAEDREPPNETITLNYSY